jgi:hypothetical protein
MTAPEIDVCVVPSDWVSRIYEADAPELRGRIAIWPAGVDPEYWKPDALRLARDRLALIYLKVLPGQHNATDAQVQSAQDVLKRAGFAVTLLQYGSFGHVDYLRLLQAADALVYFSPTESQSVSLAEAWAADVPTLVWDQGRFTYKGRDYRTSSAPFLSSHTGAAFEDSDALAALMQGWDHLRATFRPRAWVLEHMTDVKSASVYWHLAHSRKP